MPSAPVSVVIPAYNAERYLGEAIESVLAQTVAPRQVIVVDDGSEDESAAVACRFAAVTVLPIAHTGVGAALNRGVAAAREEYLAFLDADDLWLPDKLERQLAVLAAAEAPAMVFGGMASFYSPDAEPSLRQRVACPPPQPGYSAGALLTRRATAARVGTFRNDLRIGHFVEWYDRAGALGLGHVMLPEVVLRRRLHGGNLSLRESAARQDFARIARAALERRRAPS